VAISIEGRETGNRWAVGMMDVLLASVALWSGRSRECLERGSEAIELFREIGDRWGEVMATSSVVRALAELGEKDEYETALARYYEVARTMPLDRLLVETDSPFLAPQPVRGKPLLLPPRLPQRRRRNSRSG
jgi:hypothetical protein